MANRAGQSSLLGKGIYNIPEASALTGVSTGRIRRWLRGYRFRSGSQDHRSPPLWAPQLPDIEGKMALGFLDLLEVRFVDAFLSEGVTWPTLRKAAAKAADLVDSSHPFCTKRFKTDGRHIFAELLDTTGEASLIELTKSQHYFEKIIRPYLKGLEFEADEPARWWPLGTNREVVLDPQRSFGLPIVDKAGIQTAVLAKAVGVNKSVRQVAAWYETDLKAVRDAVEFERQIRNKQAA